MLKKKKKKKKMNDRIKDWLDFFSVCSRRACNNVLPGL